MTALSVFPTLPGLTLPIKRKAMHRTSVPPDTSVSGRETRMALWSYPRYAYELIFEFLRAGSFAEYQTLLGFYNLVHGRANYWAFNDPTDNAATAESLGTGDGTTTAFQLIRNLGSFVDPIYVPVGTPTILVNAVSTGAFTLGANGLITFNTPPANGAALTWTGTYRWLCRFDDDALDFQRDYGAGEDGGPIWSLATCKFTTEKP